MRYSFLFVYLLCFSLLAEGELKFKVDVVSNHGLLTKLSLPANFNSKASYRLKDLTTGKDLLFQVDVDQNSLWFQATTKGEYELYPSGKPLQPDKFTTELSSTRLKVTYEKKPIFDYHHAHELVGDHKISGKSLKDAPAAKYVRSGFIHPLFSPKGDVLTDNFPLDHPHHKGIWFAWTNTEIDGTHIDFWNLGKQLATVQFKKFSGIDTGALYSEFKAEHEWQNSLKGSVSLKEQWTVRTTVAKKGSEDAWVIDLTSEQLPIDDIKLPKYRYGGFVYRGTKEWWDEKHTLLTSEGKNKKNAHTTRARWMANSGLINGKKSTVVIMGHKENFRFPESIRVWPTKAPFCNFAPSQLGDWFMKKSESMTWRYRIVTYQGEIDKEWIDEVWQNFVNPTTGKRLK
ncbi:MAG: PmoA family protein [Lentisphaeraceae bacterium]|nr:PmoA family protein [Lentisphaeraceae bacterium]